LAPYPKSSLRAHGYCIELSELTSLEHPLWTVAGQSASHRPHFAIKAYTISNPYHLSSSTIALPYASSCPSRYLLPSTQLLTSVDTPTRFLESFIHSHEAASLFPISQA
jgi:hypothetical protein